MKKASPAQLELARQLLASEVRSVPDPAAAAAQMYDRILLHLSPLVGTQGVHALFARSARLGQIEHPCLQGFTAIKRAQEEEQRAEILRACLQLQAPTITLEPAETLFGIFFTLLATLIGERLTEQVLQGLWPEAPDADPAKRKI